MKNLVRYITVLIVIPLAFSCSNDFLKDELEHVSPESASIIISPDWDAQDYEIYCPNVGNAKFKIIHAPDWLKISTSSGQFTNGFATLNCKANTHYEFSEVGIYYTYMTLSVEGKGNQTILIAYLTEGNPVIETVNNLTIDYNFHGGLLVKNTGNGILLLSILNLPEWLSIDGEIVSIEEYPTIVLPPNGEEIVYFFYNRNIPPILENLSGKIVMITNDKNKPVVEVDVQIGLGYPTLYSYYDQLNFGRTKNDLTIDISNQGSGILKWEIENCPEWLIVSDFSGALFYNENKSLTFTCNRELLPRGANEVAIYFKTNERNKPSFKITVTARNTTANPENVKPIEGNITDTYFDKQSDILYLTTTQPNRFVAYDTKNKMIARELSLDYTPNCFSLSEDGHQLIIGHNKYITYIDVDKFSILKTYNVDYNILNIAWGTDNWCCYTIRTNIVICQLQQWKNLDTEETYNTPNISGGCLDNSLIGKIPYKNYIVVSKPFYHTHIFDIQTRNFIRLFLTEIDNFWFSSDGNYLFSSSKNIYTTSSFLNLSSSDYFVSPFGRFSPDPNRIYWVDHHADSHSVWVLSADFDEQSEVIQYRDNDYTHVKTYYCDDFYNDNLVRAHYVFANKSGTELIAIRNVTSGEPMWSLEFIEIEE